MGVLLAHGPRLLNRALRAADDVLLLERLDPETRRKIRKVGNDGDEWPFGIHGRPGFRDLSIEVGNHRNQKICRMLAKEPGQKAHHRPVKQPDSGLEDAQELGGAQCPAVAQENVVLLLDANASELPEDVQLVSQVLKLNQFHLPWALLLHNNSLESQSGVAMAAPCIMKKDVNFLHRGHCCMLRGGSYKSTHTAMWKTQKAICVQ